MRDDYHGQVNLATVDDLFVVRSYEIISLNKSKSHEIDGGNKMHLLFWRIIAIIKHNICPFLSQAPWYWLYRLNYMAGHQFQYFDPDYQHMLMASGRTSRIRKIRV